MEVSFFCADGNGGKEKAGADGNATHRLPRVYPPLIPRRKSKGGEVCVFPEKDRRGSADYLFSVRVINLRLENFFPEEELFKFSKVYVSCRGVSPKRKVLLVAKQNTKTVSGRVSKWGFGMDAYKSTVYDIQSLKFLENGYEEGCRDDASLRWKDIKEHEERGRGADGQTTPNEEEVPLLKGEKYVDCNFVEDSDDEFDDGRVAVTTVVESATAAWVTAPPEPLPRADKEEYSAARPPQGSTRQVEEEKQTKQVSGKGVEKKAETLGTGSRANSRSAEENVGEVEGKDKETMDQKKEEKGEDNVEEIKEQEGKEKENIDSSLLLGATQVFADEYYNGEDETTEETSSEFFDLEAERKTAGRTNSKISLTRMAGVFDLEPTSRTRERMKHRPQFCMNMARATASLYFKVWNRRVIGLKKNTLIGVSLADLRDFRVSKTEDDVYALRSLLLPADSETAGKHKRLENVKGELRCLVHVQPQRKEFVRHVLVQISGKAYPVILKYRVEWYIRDIRGYSVLYENSGSNTFEEQVDVQVKDKASTMSVKDILANGKNLRKFLPKTLCADSLMPSAQRFSGQLNYTTSLKEIQELLLSSEEGNPAAAALLAPPEENTTDLSLAAPVVVSYFSVYRVAELKDHLTQEQLDNMAALGYKSKKLWDVSWGEQDGAETVYWDDYTVLDFFFDAHTKEPHISELNSDTNKYGTDDEFETSTSIFAKNKIVQYRQKRPDGSVVVRECPAQSLKTIEPSEEGSK